MRPFVWLSLVAKQTGGEEVGLPCRNVFAIFLREGFSNDELTKFINSDETELLLSLGWEPWLKTALETIQYDAERRAHLLCWGKTYQEELEVVFKALTGAPVWYPGTLIRKIPASIGNIFTNPSVVSLPKGPCGGAVTGRRLTKDFGSASMMPVSLEYAHEQQIRNNVWMMSWPRTMIISYLDNTTNLKIMDSIIVDWLARIPTSGDQGLLRLLYGSRRPRDQYDGYLLITYSLVSSQEKWTDLLFVQPIGLKITMVSRGYDHGRWWN